ncbi:hypothetical protein [Streptomyces sp. R02]|uniref:Lipoprotein n=1 Tax=Streptomyces sp. R02 TaxID=3238623 RepID=A0AB39LEA3_9ACTN
MRTTTLLGSLLAILAVAVSACSSQNRAISSEEVHKLAGSAQAGKARQAAEERLRTVIQAYTDHTPLSLGMIVIRDRCLGGEKTRRFDPNGYDPYKIKCSLSISAYYGADPSKMGNVLDSILDGGDVTGSLIAFGHDYYHDHLVDYHRGQGSDPIGVDAGEPTQLSNPDQTLSWDPVRDRNPRRMVQEPDVCLDHNPPVTRCVVEPTSKTVAAICKQYGMVFRLDLSVPESYKVPKK